MSYRAHGRRALELLLVNGLGASANWQRL